MRHLSPAARNDYNRNNVSFEASRAAFFAEPEGGLTRGEMELTFSCKNCGAVGYVSPLEEALEATCRHCGTARTIDPAGCAGWRAPVLPDLHDRRSVLSRKIFPRALGLFIVLVGFAISTVFWYYEMPLFTYLVLIISIALDFLMYYQVPDVTICYRCLSQFRGKGLKPVGRFKPFDLGIGERYRQERMRAEQIRESQVVRRKSGRGRSRVLESMTI